MKRHRTIRFAAGENLTGAASLVFTVDATRYPNGTAFAYSFSVFTEDAPNVKLFDLGANVVVANLAFAVAVSSATTATIKPGSFGWELWDTTNGQLLAGGRLVLMAPKR